MAILEDMKIEDAVIIRGPEIKPTLYAILGCVLVLAVFLWACV